MKFSLKKKITATILGGALAITALAGCVGPTKRDAREQAQAQSVSQGETLEIKNLKEKRKREESASSIRYLYLLSFGKPIGYYVTKGKISSNGSQIGPETEIVNGGGNGNVLDSAQDDGSYGAGDPGIFFFTTNGTMVVTDLDYIQSDAPLPVDVPLLGGSDKK